MLGAVVHRLVSQFVNVAFVNVTLQRAAWFPFFDDINAIIFMVPLNCYDEILEEDDRVNRLDDSVLIWKAICSTKILANVQLVVFFNKCDLLAKKLRNGRAQVKDHFPTFGDRKQDVKTVAGCQS